MKFLKKLGSTLASVCAFVIPVALLALSPWWGLLLAGVGFALWMQFTRSGRQARLITGVAILTIRQRLGATAVIVVGIAGVVGVLVALLAMAAGFEATLKETGTDDTVIIVRAGSQSETNSVLTRETADVIAQAPQILKAADGRPMVSPELVVVASLPKRSTGLDANVQIRGVGDRAISQHKGFKIIAGRPFQPGMHEVIAGKGAHEQFQNLDLGASLKLNGQVWTVVGVFDSGDAHNSEVWGDTPVVGAAYHRGASFASVTVQLTGASTFDAFKAQLKSDPRLQVDALTTRDYYNRQSESLSKLIRILGTSIATIMAIGAVFGALNTMYAAVSTRAREIATLRAIGFRGGPVVVSVLLETMLLAFLGGLIGAAIAWALFDNYTASTLGQDFSQIVFSFKVSPALLWNGLKWALAIGFVGGFFPAIRAARMPVTDALRQL